MWDKISRAINRPFTVTLQDYWERALPARSSFQAILQTRETGAGDPAPSTTPSSGKLTASSASPDITEAIQIASRKYDVPEKLITSVIHAESNFNPNAVSPAGARGLMQLMPGTARELGVKNSFNVQENIEGGVKYLRQMLNRFGQNIKLALAAYNAGPGAVAKHDGIPPYAETRKYVQKIMSNYTAEV